jgi:hypothetical protein
MSEADDLLHEIEELEKQLEPKKARLREIWNAEADAVDLKRKRCLLMKDRFTLDELRVRRWTRLSEGNRGSRLLELLGHPARESHPLWPRGGEDALG